MQTAHLNTATVILQKEFDCKVLSQPNGRPECLMFNTGYSIKNEKFPQPILTEEKKGTIFFEPITNGANIGQIISLYFDKAMADNTVSNELALRALYALMRTNDPLLQTISGKNIVIPIVSVENDYRDKKVIVFCSIYKDQPVWGVDLEKITNISAYNAVVPILL